jgi:hypothetical protein
MVLYVALGVVLGGVILFVLYGWFHERVQKSTQRLNEHWQKYWGTPLNVSVFLVAEDYLYKKYGEEYQSKIARWALDRGLVISPEKRIQRLQALAKENEGKKDRDWDMHFYYMHHMAIRQWAGEVGLEAAFDKWVDESIEQLKSIETEAGT